MKNIKIDLPINPQYYFVLGKNNVLHYLANQYAKHMEYKETSETPEVTDFEKQTADEVFKLLITDSRGKHFMEFLLNCFIANLTMKNFGHVRSIVSIDFV